MYPPPLPPPPPRVRRGLIGSNRGELARGWYERVNQPGVVAPEVEEKQRVEEEESEEEVVGPFLPGQEPGRRRKVGPKVPTVEDLDMQRGSTPLAFLLWD